MGTKTCVSAGLCVLLIWGCARAPKPGDPLPPVPLSAVYLDVAASPQWLAAHKVVASWEGRQVTLPACITFQRRPATITFGGYADQNETRVEFGTKRFDITSEPAAPITFVPYSTQGLEGKELIWRSGIAYWTLCPADSSGQDPAWRVPAPSELQSRIAGGTVSTVSLPSP